MPTHPSIEGIIKAETLQALQQAAVSTVRLLNNLGYSCAFFGSFACRLYGNSRIPKDVDILVLPPKDTHPDIETIKADITHQSVDFVLNLPRDTRATYRILRYIHPQTGRSCKVDLVLPGIMHLPHLPVDDIRWVSSFPVVPLGVLLLHKLQAWDDHRNSTEPWKHTKQHQDAADVRRMLGLYVANPHGFERGLGSDWNNEELFHSEFLDLSIQRVLRYCQAFPARSDGWRRLGFETRRPVY